MMLFELRKLLVDAKWPAHAIAVGAKVAEAVVTDFLADKVMPTAAECGRISAWADLHTGQTSTGGIVFDQYRGVQVMGEIIAADCKIVGEGYETAGVQDLTAMTVTGETETLGKVAAMLAHKGGALTGVGTGVTADKIIRGEQVVRKEKAA
ncbi:MAG: hypothetical protein E5Y02_10395 [Mesorhizobium sp.]|nr:MAG: hypothetical protein E5Y02_10395 [Mesorhizobium sp.]